MFIINSKLNKPSVQSMLPQPLLQTQVSGAPQYPPLKHPLVHCAIKINCVHTKMHNLAIYECDIYIILYYIRTNASSMYIS